MAEPRTGSLLTIDPDLEARLKALAERSGMSLPDLTRTILRAHVEEQERLIDELAEDERRWQRYLAEGQSVPFEAVRTKLHALARQAAQKAGPR